MLTAKPVRQPWLAAGFQGMGGGGGPGVGGGGGARSARSSASRLKAAVGVAGGRPPRPRIGRRGLPGQLPRPVPDAAGAVQVLPDLESGAHIGRALPPRPQHPGGPPAPATRPRRSCRSPRRSPPARSSADRALPTRHGDCPPVAAASLPAGGVRAAGDGPVGAAGGGWLPRPPGGCAAPGWASGRSPPAPPTARRNGGHWSRRRWSGSMPPPAPARPPPPCGTAGDPGCRGAARRPPPPGRRPRAVAPAAAKDRVARPLRRRSRLPPTPGSRSSPESGRGRSTSPRCSWGDIFTDQLRVTFALTHDRQFAPRPAGW